jgi:spermidine/putrescine transport system ATP-binding protein
MRVADNVAFGLRMKRLPARQVIDRVERMLTLVELPSVGTRYPNQLSGGQQQRIALARALINEPTVLLLDEPLGALDLKVRRRMQQELKRIHREVGVTFIYVTHDQEEALTMSERIAVMNHGRIEQLDSPSAVYERPANKFVANFIGLTNALPGVVEGYDGGSFLVRLQCGVRLRGVATEGIPSGTRVEVTVRPEKIDLSPTRPMGDDNCLEGRVGDVVYQGASTEYQVMLPDGSMLRATLPNHDARSRASIAVGSSIFAHWSPGATLAMLAADSTISSDPGEDATSVIAGQVD